MKEERNHYVVIKPNEKVQVIEKDISTIDTHDLLRKTVEGYIECVALQDDIDIWLNEEGKLIGLEPSLALVKNGEIVDLLMGNLLVAGRDDEGETISLTIDQLETFGKLIEDDGGTVVITLANGEKRNLPYIEIV